MVEADGRTNYVEVKGVTLEENGVAMFPGAPTTRGVKHVRGLTAAAAEGYGAYVVFVAQMSPVRLFTPNCPMDPDFCEALAEAAENGVEIAAYECDVSPEGIGIKGRVPHSFRTEFP